MVNQELTIKRIERNSRFNDLCTGDLVEIVGIESKDQTDFGRVLDRNVNSSRLDMVAVRNGPLIELQSYISTTQGIQRGVCKLIYSNGNPGYALYNQKLSEVGL